MNISVIIPVFNAEKFVEQAVLSAIAHTETKEVLLIEDGSMDRSPEICDRLNKEHESVRLLKHDGGVNKGAGASRNLGILNARCDYIAFLDADDFYLPGRFTAASKLLKGRPDIDGVYEATGITFETDSASRAWEKSPLRRGRRITTITKKPPPDELFSYLVLGGRGYFHTNAITVKRSIFRKCGLFDENLLLHQDTAMWIKMSAKGRLVGGEIERPVAIRRVHENNRILSQPKGPSKHLIEMDRILLKWGRDSGLTKEQMDLLRFRQWRNRLFNYDLHEMDRIQNGRGNLLVREFRKIFFLISNLIKSPLFMISPHLFRLIILSVGRFTEETRKETHAHNPHGKDPIS